MGFSSTGWIIIIAIGAVIVTVGNIKYQQTRELERTQQMVQQARKLLEPELIRNYGVLYNTQVAISREEFRFEAFDITAWQTVSDGGLLLGCEPEELTKLLEIYHHLNRATLTHARFVDAITGGIQPKAGLKTIRNGLQGELKKILDKTEPLLKEYLESLGVTFNITQEAEPKDEK